MKNKIKVYHSYYGCDTGCCGHIVEIDGKREGGFNFGHPHTKQSLLEFAKEVVEQELGKNHCKDLDWDSADLSEILTDDKCG